MILQLDLHDFAVLAWVRDEAGEPVYRIVRQGIKAQDRRDTRAEAPGRRTMMDRRAFLGIVALLAAPRVAEAQQGGKVPRIGILGTGPPGTSFSLQAFQKGLQDLGYVEGQHVHLDYRWPEGGPEGYPPLALQMVRSRVDVILTISAAPALAAKRATDTLPIVFCTLGDDPVRLGLVASLARPGGNATGTVVLSRELEAKRLELLKEAVPGLSRAAVLWRAGNPTNSAMLQDIEEAARRLGIRVVPADWKVPDDIEKAFQVARRERVEGACSAEPRDLARARAYCPTGAQASTADGGDGAALCRSRQSRAIRARPFAILPSGCPLCGSYPEGRQAWRPARRATDQVRAGDQPQDGQGARPDAPAVAAAAGGPGHRVSHQQEDEHEQPTVVRALEPPRVRDGSNRGRGGWAPRAGPLPVAAEPPPETTKVRRLNTGASCLAPLFVAEELLKAEGFKDVQYVKVPPGNAANKALVTGDVDFSANDALSYAMTLDAGGSITLLAGIHAGCYELFATERVRTVATTGKIVGVPGLGGGRHAFVASIAASIGLDPRKDLEFVVHSPVESIRLLAEGKIDAYMAFPPDPQELRAKKIGHVLVDTKIDRPWSQYFCCMLAGNGEFVRRHPAATKRVLRAMLKAGTLCARARARGAPRRASGARS